MIAKDFVYCLPDTEQEAVEAFETHHKQGKQVLYYGGGSEIITMATAGSIAPDVVIDLKVIPAMRMLETWAGQIVLGGAVSLEAIRNSKLFPFLGTVGGRIADHTNQCRITLGGNLCGTVIYRETALPLLLSDAQIAFWGPGGRREARLCEAFQGRMRLREGEFVHQVRVDADCARMPYAHIKQTFGEKIGYPAVTVSALFDAERLRVAFSGICHEPFRSEAMEEALNDRSASPHARVRRAVEALPFEPLSDPEGSGEYRMCILQKLLTELLERQEHENL